METWDLYDEHRNLTGETMIRSDDVPPGRYHLVVHICIFNSKGELLIQHRQPFKDSWADMWDLTVGGSALAGETSQQAAQREVAEEIGYRLDLSGTTPAITVGFREGFNDIYIVERDLDISHLTLQPEEVAEVKWASESEIMKMIDDGTFIPYHKGFLDFLFFRRNTTGSRVSDIKSI